MKIGKIPERVLKRSVLKQLPIHTDKITGGAGVGEDCAVFAPENGDCTAVCVNTTTGTAGHIGSYAVHAAVNNIAAGGADPKAILVAAVFPENTEEARLRTVMKQIGDAAGALGIIVAGGHTEISGGVSEPVLSITGIGQKNQDQRACARPEKHALADKDIVMTKWAGLAGTAWIARERRAELLARYPAYFIDEAAALEQRLSVVPEAATAGKSGVLMMHDASRGGIFAALWELAQRAGVGLSVHLKAIPIRQETVEICNFYDINPYELAAGGSLSFSMPAEKLSRPSPFGGSKKRRSSPFMITLSFDKSVLPITAAGIRASARIRTSPYPFSASRSRLPPAASS
mgnify:CR=1 FL=1